MDLRGGAVPPRGRGGFGGFGDAGNFFVGQQNGINTTHSYGLNYSNKWGDKATLSGSYFFNNSKNNTDSKLSRQYFLSDTASQYYTEENLSSNNNYNNRLNIKLEYKIDSMNSFIFTPKISFQKNTSLSEQLTSTSDNEKILLNTTKNEYNTEGNGINMSNNLLLRHRFVKRGRTLSLNLGQSYYEKKRDVNQYTVINYFLPIDSIVNTDQKISSTSFSRGYSASLIYTEPIGKKGNLQLTYSTFFQ